MRVLILSCNTGQGHNSAAAAIKDVLDRQGVSCEIADAMRFISDWASRFLSWGHSFVYRHLPGLFRVGYDYSEKHAGVFQENSLVYKFLTSGAERLHQYCLKGEYDTIVSVHVFASLMLTRAKAQCQLDAKTCFVTTDYTCSPSVAQSDLDYYFIPSETLTEEFAACGLPAEKLVPAGIPIRQAFFDKKDREGARRQLGIAQECRHLLVMCGSMGCGPMRALTKRLAEELSETQEMTIVCGTNKRLERELTRRFAGKNGIRVLGYVEHIPRLMDSADLYLTKPGGISVTEAAAKHLPMVFVDAVAGCEKYNMEYFIDRDAAVTAGTPKELARLCVELLDDGERLEKMKRNLGPEAYGNGAQRVFRFITQQSGERG